VASYYLDTSVLVKCYVREPGSTWMHALVDPSAGHALYTVRLSGPEMVAALSRKARTGEMTTADAAIAIRAFRIDWGGRYRVLSVRAIVADRGMDLAERHGLRGYDAVHLAAALLVSDVRQRRRLAALTFVSADDAQRQVAAAEGLLVANPNTYP
jgi:predicted nucleic acid-binding protein